MESIGPSNFYGVIVGVAEGTGVKVGAEVGVGIAGTVGVGEAVGTGVAVMDGVGVAEGTGVMVDVGVGARGRQGPPETGRSPGDPKYTLVVPLNALNPEASRNIPMSPLPSPL